MSCFNNDDSSAYVVKGGGAHVSRVFASSASRPPRHRTLKERLDGTQIKTVHLHLPDAARTLQTLLQNSETLVQVIGRFGGCTLRIPAQWPPYGKRASFKGHPLRALLTPAQMKRLVAHYGGTDLYVPKCTQHVVTLRNISITNTFCKEIRKGRSTGSVVQQLARRYQLSDRRVWDILKIGADVLELVTE